ncbi:hypothetical protein Acr_00g0013410 [Actinidia rufa]|uniref:Uncharacterized protein n=1 Tax=Actinidia rufa TaxID=165716 RepID=A0A7J0DA16_9ERIC|nr:hypothetical protein Acr_00g0013410 [Actinidia rufa]
MVVSKYGLVDEGGENRNVDTSYVVLAGTGQTAWPQEKQIKWGFQNGDSKVYWLSYCTQHAEPRPYANGSQNSEKSKIPEPHCPRSLPSTTMREPEACSRRALGSSQIGLRGVGSFGSSILRWVGILFKLEVAIWVSDFYPLSFLITVDIGVGSRVRGVRVLRIAGTDHPCLQLEKTTDPNRRPMRSGLGAAWDDIFVQRWSLCSDLPHHTGVRQSNKSIGDMPNCMCKVTASHDESPDRKYSRIGISTARMRNFGCLDLSIDVSAQNLDRACYAVKGSKRISPGAVAMKRAQRISMPELSESTTKVKLISSLYYRHDQTIAVKQDRSDDCTRARIRDNGRRSSQGTTKDRKKLARHDFY